MIEEIGYGKINLALQITGRRADGYHDIDTVFQSVGLCDVVRVEEANDLEITCSEKSLACDESNLAYKAYAALRARAVNVKKKFVKIHIEKRIPIAAGLAGGSTDCAAVLRGLNRLWGLGLSVSELCRIGRYIGADVPFCITGGTARGMGIGDVLKPLPSLPEWLVIIVHPHASVYTKEAYALFDSQRCREHVDVDGVEQAVRTQYFTELVRGMGNTFEELIVADVPLIQECRMLLQKYGLKPLMAGSGPTTFALVPPHMDGERVFRQITAEARHMDTYISTLVRGDDNHNENE